MRLTTSPIATTYTVEDAIGVLQKPDSRGVVLRRPTLTDFFNKASKISIAHEPTRTTNSHVLFAQDLETPDKMAHLAADINLSIPTHVIEVIQQDTFMVRQILADVYKGMTGENHEFPSNGALHLMGLGANPFIPKWHPDAPALNAHVSYLFNSLEVADIDLAQARGRLHSYEMLDFTTSHVSDKDNLFSYWKPSLADIVFMKGIRGNPNNEGVSEKSPDFDTSHILFHRSPRDTAQTGAVTSIFRLG